MRHDASGSPTEAGPTETGRGIEGVGDPADPGAAGEGGVERRGTGPLAVAASVGAALLGVQSSKNRERDFTHGKPIHFVIGGLIGTLLFLLAIWLLVQYVIITS